MYYVELIWSYSLRRRSRLYICDLAVEQKSIVFHSDIRKSYTLFHFKKRRILGFYSTCPVARPACASPADFAWWLVPCGLVPECVRKTPVVPRGLFVCTRMMAAFGRDDGRRGAEESRNAAAFLRQKDPARNICVLPVRPREHFTLYFFCQIALVSRRQTCMRAR